MIKHMEQKKCKIYTIRRKIAARNWMLNLWLVLQEMRRLNRDLFWQSKVELPSWKDITQLNFQNVNGKDLNNFLLLKRSNKWSFCMWCKGPGSQVVRPTWQHCPTHTVIALEFWSIHEEMDWWIWGSFSLWLRRITEANVGKSYMETQRCHYMKLWK